MPNIELRLGNDVLVIQGAMETMLESQGFEGCLPFLNLTEPESVEELHRRYRAAGADCAVTNTLYATSSRLAEHGLAAHADAINAEGVRIARSVGFPHVLAAMGPAGVEVEPGSGLAALRAQDPQVSEAVLAQPVAPGYAVAVEQYAEQAAALASACPDAIYLEGFTNLDDALAAVDGARRATDLPVIACMSSAPDFAQAAGALAQAGAAAIGCTRADLPATLAALAHMRAATVLPLVACPTAPDKPGLTQTATAQAFADASVELLRAGARLIGSSCGSNPACTGAIFATVGGLVFPEA